MLCCCCMTVGVWWAMCKIKCHDEIKNIKEHTVNMSQHEMNADFEHLKSDELWYNEI